jgi:hypothetical protein
MLRVSRVGFVLCSHRAAYERAEGLVTAPGDVPGTDLTAHHLDRVAADRKQKVPGSASRA